jgi:hypothetical protein
MTTNDTRTKCPECGAYDGHGIECELKTPAEWRAAALQYHKAWNESEKPVRERYKERYEHWDRSIRKACEQVTHWQGKFRIVKHENNQLRKKLK